MNPDKRQVAGETSPPTSLSGACAAFAYIKNHVLFSLRRNFYAAMRCDRVYL